ncbi:DUF6049 family protein [Oerskovia rustica]|uniref:Uncharacterized protein n=1 Tax=Oerskovia rustica TaxID=2762237 RepID=A0ABR8RNW7_9CELL|nr:DUF6049 family protein [Oerskovia rustica]MBD7949424.1 hypothetical protein [Oerskovia rustica]
MSFHFPGGARRASTRRPAARDPLSSQGAPAHGTPRSSTTATRRASRSRTRALLTSLFVLGLAVLPSAAAATPTSPTALSVAEDVRTAPPGTGVAADTDPTTSSAEAGAVSTTLVSMSPATVGPGDTLTVVARIHNGTQDTLESPRATLGVNWRVVGTRSALDAWAEAPTSQQVAGRMTVENLDPLAPGQDTTVTFSVAADDLNLAPGSAWGPRPLSVTVEDGGERLDVLRTFFLWGESPAPLPVKVSLIAPVTGPALGLSATTGDAGTPGTTSVEVHAVDEAVDADRRLGRLVSATADVPEIAWAIDPAILAAAETSAAPASHAWATLVREGTAARTVFGLRPYDPDPAAYAQVGATLPATTTPLPGGATLDPAWRTDLTYPTDDVLDQRTVRTSVQSGSPLVVVRGDGLAPESSVNHTPTGLATVATDAGPATALVADHQLTKVFTEATSFERDADDLSAADATQRLLADLAVVASERPTETRHLVVALPRSWDPDAAALSAVLGAFHGASWVDVSSIDDLLSSPVPDVARTSLPGAEVTEGTLPAAEMNALERARAEVADFATIASDPAPVVQGAEPALVVPSAIAYRSLPDERTEAVDTAVEGAAMVRSSVSVVPRGLDVMLINTSGNLPVRVRNALDQPVTVQVALRPDNGLLKVVSFPAGPVPAGAEVDFKVPVRAIGSGDVSVSVELLSVPAGTVVSPPSEFVVQVRAEWENTGTAIFAGVVALLMIGGIWRTIRRGRSPRRVAELTPATGVPGAQGGATPSGRSTGHDG